MRYDSQPVAVVLLREDFLKLARDDFDGHGIELLALGASW